MTKQAWLFSFLGTFALLMPMTARADAIIPYMVVPYGQVFLLPAVILIEGYILYRLANGKVLAAIFQSFLANIASTLLGAAMYFSTMPQVGNNLFQWWFKGGFASEAIRNACIALGFAVGLWTISWVSETLIIARLRHTTFRAIAPPAAKANFVTYILLLGLALWFQH